MYINYLGQVLQKAKQRDKYNCLTVPTHERYETSLSKTGHNFYALRNPQVKDWKTCYAPVPPNYTVFNIKKQENQIPHHLSFDMVLSQNKFGQYQILAPIAKEMDIPLITVEHTAKMPWWNKQQMAQLQEMRGQLNVFITDWSLKSWEWENRGDTYIIEHCVDTDLFKPDENIEPKNHILTVGNDYIGRDSVLNFSQYKRVCLDKGLPTRAVGDTPGLSKAAATTEELVSEYQNSRIFLNTHHISPMPTSLLEAMACGCAIVTCATAAIPTYINHGDNGFLYNTDEECLEYLLALLNDEDLAIHIGIQARKTIMERCTLERFVNEWQMIFNHAYKLKGML